MCLGQSRCTCRGGCFCHAPSFVFALVVFKTNHMLIKAQVTKPPSRNFVRLNKLNGSFSCMIRYCDFVALKHKCHLLIKQKKINCACEGLSESHGATYLLNSHLEGLRKMKLQRKPRHFGQCTSDATGRTPKFKILLGPLTSRPLLGGSTRLHRARLGLTHRATVCKKETIISCCSGDS